MRSRRTSVRLDFGSVVHVVFGFLAAILHQEWLLTTIFLVKQILDFLDCEDAAETSGDIVEFVAGMLLGWFIQLL